MNDLTSRKLKRLCSVLLVGGVLLSFTACKGDEASSSSSSSSASSTPPSSSSAPPVKKPVPPSQEILDKLEDGFNQNTDVVAYIKIPNTPAEGLVLQNPDDNLYYERRDITKEYNWYGCYYADKGNTFGTRDMLSTNTIIYAHNMSDRPDNDKKEDQKFSQLLRYKDLEWAKNNPYVYLATEKDDMAWEIFAAYYSDTKFQYHRENPSDTQFEDIIKEAKLRSENIYDVEVTKDDYILTLSTCTYKYGGENNHEQRFVVQAKLVPTGENTKATASVQKNPSPKPPEFSPEVQKMLQ